MTTPTSQAAALLQCSPGRVRLHAPAEDVRIATDGEQAVVGVILGGRLTWAPQRAPAPVALIDDADSVAYQKMWSGVPMVELPCRAPLQMWFSDGESQVLLLRLSAAGFPELILA